MTNSLSERIIKNILSTFLLSGTISFMMQLLWVLCFSELNDSFIDNIFNIWMIFVFSIGMSAFLSIFTLITVLLNLIDQIREVYIFRILTFFTILTVMLAYSLSEENFMILNIVIFFFANAYSFYKFNHDSSDLQSVHIIKSN